MLHWIISSTSKLSDFIECYWFIEKNSGCGDSFPKLNPDPSAHLILAPRSEPYSYSFEKQQELGQGSHFLLAHQNTFELNHSKSFTHLGVKFKVGVPYMMSLTTNDKGQLDVVKQVDTNELLSVNETALCELFELARQSPDGCIAKLEAILTPWMEQTQHDQHSQLTFRVVEALQETSISVLADRLHCSKRTIERSFRRVTGLTLKQYEAMTKLELMLEYLYQKQTSQIDWVDIAFQFGFSDQPHLIRYLKQQIGITPNKYLLERGFTIDVYGGVSSS